MRKREFQPDRIPIPKSGVSFPSEWGQSIDLEIGCGVGYHPIQWGKTHPNRMLIAIEQTKTRFGSFQGRIQHHPEIVNVLPVHDDAVSWVTHRVPESSVRHCFLLYPNPYPKHAQRNKRWHQMPFMEFLLSRIQPGGDLTIATNERFYYEEATTLMGELWGWNHCEVTRCKDVFSLHPRTHFERKYLSRGEDCFNMVFRNPQRGGK
jgi:tRNA (guanine-N7-)-methyltransferase